jgi:hypothetical protein
LSQHTLEKNLSINSHRLKLNDMIIRRIVSRLGDLIEKAEKQTIEGIVEGRFETEPTITDRFLQAVEDLLKGQFEKEGIVFKTRTLKDRGPNSSEKKYGADCVGVLDVKLEGYSQTKGFLVQSKKECDWVEIQGSPFGAAGAIFAPGKEFERLKGQTDEMLKTTPDSFVFVYGRKGFSVIPASSVSGLSGVGQLYGKTMKSFFKEFFMCFVEDPRLKAWDDATLERLREEYNARTALMVQINDFPSRKQKEKESS